MAQTGLQSACPQCGAPLRFAGAHSLVSVCAHCRSSIARVGVELARLGKLPDLVAADTRLSLGQRGKLAKLSFELLGRVQLEQGRASWQEWYVSWSDGSFGWLAEAQGRIILSHRVERELHVPAWDSWSAGDVRELPGLGELHVEEVGEARFVSAEGELPFQPQAERSYRFVDASLREGGYCSLDYGTVGDDAEAFMGRALSYAEVGLEARAMPVEAQVKGQALDCPTCGAPLDLRSKDSLSVVCPSCRSLCDATQGKLALIAQLGARSTPPVPLGARGKLFGEELEVIGFMRQSCSSGGQEYSWSQYLLHGAAGYRWLSESDGHFCLLKPLLAAQVTALAPNQRLLLDGETYRHFQHSADVKSFDLQGEFYWQVQPEDRVQLDDFVAPPYLVSRETSGKEVSWTWGRYLDGGELWRSFKLPAEPPARHGVSLCQPNPYRASARSQTNQLGFALSAFLLLALLCGVFLPRQTVLSIPVPVEGPTPVTLSDPFSIAGSTHAATIEAETGGMQNAWIGLDVALINDDTGHSDELSLALSHYEGYDGGEHWSEGSLEDSKSIGSVPPGRYVLRVELQTERSGASLPPTVQVRVRHGSFLWFPLWLGLLALCAPPLWSWLRSASFESQRWSQSDHAPTGDD